MRTLTPGRVQAQETEFRECTVTSLASATSLPWNAPVLCVFVMVTEGISACFDPSVKYLVGDTTRHPDYCFSLGKNQFISPI